MNSSNNPTITKLKTLLSDYLTRLTMPPPILPAFLSQLLYPAILTGFGLIGNVYILGGQIKEMKDDLVGQIKEVKDDLVGQIKGVKDDLGGQIRDMKGDIKDTNNGIKCLLARQTELEPQDMSLAQKFFNDCGKDN